MVFRQVPSTNHPPSAVTAEGPLGPPVPDAAGFPLELVNVSLDLVVPRRGRALAGRPPRSETRRQRGYPAAGQLLVVQGPAVAVTLGPVDAHARLEAREEARRGLLRGRGRGEAAAGLLPKAQRRLLLQHRVEAARVLLVLGLVRVEAAQDCELVLLGDLGYVLHAGRTSPDLDLPQVIVDGTGTARADLQCEREHHLSMAMS